MFKVVDRRGNLYGVLDTNDSSVEYYSYSQLDEIIKTTKVVIEGCSYYKNEADSVTLFVYTQQDILFDGNEFKLVLNSIGECVYLITPSRGNDITAEFWISQRRSNLVFKNCILSQSHRTSCRVDRRLLVYACKTAKEFNTDCDSLFLNFGTCILEMYIVRGNIKYIEAHILEKET